jgi:argininosuccinate lyase
VFSMFRDAARAVRLVAAAMRGAEFDAARMAARAATGWVTVTELADTLARDHGVPSKAGHAIASGIVERAPGDGDLPLSRVLHDVSIAILGRPIELGDETLARILSPQHFVEVRTTPGGPAPAETTRALERSEAVLAEDGEWFSTAVARLKAAEKDLKDSVAALGS